MDDILITGSDGVLGSYFRGGIRTDLKDFDVTDLAAVMKKCEEQKPRVIIHLASLTDLDLCEREPEKAYRVNAVGTYHVALAARAVGAKLVYLSTSGVFDGTKADPYVEDDIPNPLNVYGHTKYLGEIAVRGVLEDFIIVRSSWLFGGGKEKDKKFVGKVMAQLDAPHIRAVGDRKGSPTYAKDLAEATMTLVTEGKRGIFHLGGGVATRHDVAREIVSLTGSKAEVLQARSDDFPLRYVSGENESIVSSLSMRPWKNALAEYLQKEWNVETIKR